MEIGLRMEDRLNGANTFRLMKERFVLVLQKFELWDIVEKAVTIPIDPVKPADLTRGMLGQESPCRCY